MSESPDNTALPDATDRCPELPSPVAAEEEPSPSCPVVGVGASAGGLEAFTQLLKHLPPDTGMAYVLVQHLDPHHESILSDLLASHSAMPVKQASQGTQIEPNSVYIIPPNTTMSIARGTLRLTPRGDLHGRHLPIDVFLCSLAEDQKSRAIGVILSGSASDGTLGLRAIKSAGGITFAQDQTAKIDSMPRNAIAAGAVDFVLPPEAIAREIAGIARHAYLQNADPGSPIEDGPVLQKILTLLRSAKMVDFTHYKAPTIKRRLSRRMALHRKTDPEAYLALLEQEPGELNALFDDLLINVTEFFRDSGVFEALSNTVLPAILKDRQADEPIRVWVPACSSGEEVYSIAICLAECLEQSLQWFPIQIFGTDISSRAIEIARAGKYPESIESVVSPERLKRFFIKSDEGYQISQAIRELCIFSRHDLTKDPPLSRMDLISCRNLLIYLASVLQRRVLAAFNYALKPSGSLILGKAESLGSLTDNFVSLDREHKVFARNLEATQPNLEVDASRLMEPAAPFAMSPKPDDAGTLLDRDADRLVAEDYGPCGLLVDSYHRVVKFRGDVGFYIAPPTGNATLDLYRLVREDLLFTLRTMLEEAASSNLMVRKERVQVRRNEAFEDINIVVRPLSRPGTERYFLVLFEETPQESSRELRQKRSDLPSRRGHGGPGVAEESASTRAYLQSLIEELRTANEEAQSSNEELQSTNEELQTAKEELQSSNEELTTTNEEMKSRNTELSQVNNDLLNLLSSMRSPIVMLNKELRIRRFTPLAEKALNLIATDVGRPISDLKPRINVPDLEQLLGQVIYSVSALEREVQDQEGHWYSMRLNPYRTSENHVEGAVLQLLDIDQLKRTVQSAEHARNYSDAIFETVREPLVVLDGELRVQTANQAFFETFNVTPEQTQRHNIFEVSDRLWNIPEMHRLLEDVSASGQTRLQDVDVEVTIPNAGRRTFQLNARSLKSDGAAGQILLALEDVSDRKRAAEARFRHLFEAARDGILIVEAEHGEITDANPFILDLFGYRREEIVGKPFWEAGPLLGLPEARASLERVKAEQVVHFQEVALRAKDGRRIETETVGNMYREGDKQVIQFNIRDVTERRHFDRQFQQTAKLESLGLLAGGVAHDFNNLLTGIMGNASLILDNAPPDSQDREQLREILKASQKAADLTRQMLAYSGRGRFIVEPINLSQQVQEISSLLKSSIPRTIRLDLQLDEQLPPVQADATQIQQLVMNLVINGAEAIGEARQGSVRVTTRQEMLDAEVIRLNYSADDLKPGTYVSLEVTDTGVGMDEATRDKIFDPFFTTKFTGRGLGLSAALGIVRGHRGAIRVYSAPGRGTTFKVLFPASRAAEKRKLRPAKSQDLRGAGLVLVVDDEEMVLRVAAPMLQRYGYHVLTAPDGAAALNIVREQGEKLDLIVLDLMMPVMGGEEALAQIKAIRPDVPVILSSGYDQAQAQERFGAKHLAGFIQKPYSVQKLLETVKAALRQ